MVSLPRAADGQPLDADDYNQVPTLVEEHDDRLLAVETIGALGYAERTSGQGGITTETDLTSLTVTVTVGSGRRIRVSGYVPVGGNTLDGRASVAIKEGTTGLQSATITIRRTDNGTSGSCQPVVILTPTAGSHTYKLAMTGTGATVQSNASTAAPGWILAEDIGAA